MNRRMTWPATVGVLCAATVLGVLGGGLIGASQPRDAPQAGATSTPTDQDRDTGTPDPATSEPTDDDASGGGPSPASEAMVLTLTSQQPEVASNQRIDLEGSLQPAEPNVTFVVQRRTDGSGWEDFPSPDDPVTAITRGDGSFSTWVVSGRSGANDFRLVGTVDGTEVVSDAVAVTIG